MKRTSLTARLLFVLLGTSVVIAGIAVMLIASTFLRIFEDDQVEALEAYITERSAVINAPFATIRTAHEAAIEALQYRLAIPASEEIDAEFDRLFPLQPDGSRRSRDDLFEGYADARGDWNHGTAAILTSGRDDDPEVRRLLVSAYHVVDNAGEALSGSVDSLYFFTGFSELIISAPGRDDRLEYYRHDAPASFDLQREATFTQLARRDVNPEGRFICTDLSPIIYVRDQNLLATACFSPVRENGRHLGAFGTSVPLSSYFREVFANPPAGGTNILLDRAGSLIAHPDMMSDVVRAEEVAQIEAHFDTDGIFEAVAYDGLTQGLVTTADGRWTLAYATLEGPGWYFVSVLDRRAVQAAALQRTMVIFAFALAGIIAQAALIYFILLRRIVYPINTLTRHFGRQQDNSQHTSDQVAGIMVDPSEIGTLARSLENNRQSMDKILGELEERVDERTRELAEANASKSVFLANMSHELRTPLNGILGIAQALEAKAESTLQRKKLRMILQSGDNLSALLNDILDMSKIEAGKLELDLQPVDLHALLEEIHRLFEDSAQQKSLTLELEIDDSVPSFVSADALRVKQCLSNLVSNAIKFTQHGTVSIRASGASALNFHEITICVEDTGIGMKEEVLDQLFVAFGQADKSITPRFGGTGLGLSISQQLAQLMDGDVTASSSYGAGSTFQFRFLAAPAEAVEDDYMPSDPAALAERPEYKPLMGKRILLVEDNMINREVAKAFLKPLDAKITTAQNGLDSLSCLDRGTFDLVLMDVRMPIMDGVEATRQIRERPNDDRHLPIIALTASLSDPEVKRYHEVGMNAVIGKPLKAPELFPVMLRVLEGGSSGVQ